jgi:deoxyribodipyrimidine photolyase-related protein
VDHVQASSFQAGLHDHVARHKPAALLTMAASSYAGRRFQNDLQATLGLPVTVLPNTQFLVGRHNPIPHPAAGRRYVMETFYRAMRRHFDLLMDGGEPVGGRWNYDAENRRRLPAGVQPPAPPSFEPDAITLEVMAEVAALPSGIGRVDGFDYAVTQAEATAALDDFLARRLPDFGDYEDAMTERSHALYHSLLSPYLNLGLLEPLMLAQAAEQSYLAGRAPLNAVEGFIRQIIGWREFMYWQYWRQMPQLLSQNAWDAQRPLPEFVWTGETDMACLRHAIGRALDTGYNHHIERLMLLCNFFMLAGVNPRAVNDWFLSVYIDAYDWVMPPNVIGMGLNADGGLTSTKPYIASANYVKRMSDHCAGCCYDSEKRHGEGACPFNALYWNFILTHEERLRANPRTSRNVLGLRHLDEAERAAVRAHAELLLSRL